MDPSRKSSPVLVYFTTQAGATRKNFDRARCEREVVRPSRALLRTGLVSQIVFIILCYGDERSEEGWKEQRSGEGPAPHLISMTSEMLVEEMRNERADRSIEYLNVNTWRGMPESVMGHAIAFARGQGGGTILVYPPGTAFPSVEAVERELSTLPVGWTRTVRSSTVAATA